MKKNLAIIGSTHAVSCIALDWVRHFPDLWSVEVLASDSHLDLLAKQAQEFSPNVVVCEAEEDLSNLKHKISDLPIKIYGGASSLNDVVTWDSIDLVIVDLPGLSSVSVILSAISAKKAVAIARKEIMALAGAMIMQAAKEHNVAVYPLEFETNSILQVTRGESWSSIQKVTLAASGGPFLGKKPNYLLNVKKAHAIPEPNPNISDKIYIDAASLMNKGLDMIAAKHFFGLENHQLEVIIHPQKMIHAIVAFIDGMVKNVYGRYDLKQSVLYVLSFPNRIAIPNTSPNLLKDFEPIIFEEPDIKTFRNLQLAKDALEAGGNMTAILSTANDLAVDAFLHNKIDFVQMSDLIESVMQTCSHVTSLDLEILQSSIAEAHFHASQFLNKIN